MFAGAVQQYLEAQGLSPVHVGGFGDYTVTATPSYAVHAESAARSAHDGDIETYPVRLQLRTRASNMIDAEKAGQTAYALIMGLAGQTILWTDPRDSEERSYRIYMTRAVQRPTWYPTAEPGEEASCNFELSVRELVLVP